MPRAVVLLERVVVHRVACYYYDLEPHCIVARFVQTLARGMTIQILLMIEAEAAVCAWVRRIGRTAVCFRITLRARCFVV